MSTALQLAQQHWDAVPCHGEATVVWTGQADGQVNAMSTWANPVDAYTDPDENLDCVVALNPDASWDWPKLCTVVTHEVGHLLGRQHSPDPADVMYAMYLKPTPECESTPEPEGTLTAAIEQARASLQAQQAAFAAEAAEAAAPASPATAPASGGTVRTAPRVDAVDAGTSLSAGSTASRAAVRAVARKRATCLRRAGRIHAPARRRAARRACSQAGLRAASAASRESFDALGGVVAPRRRSGSEPLALAPFGLLLLLLASGRAVRAVRLRGRRAA